MHLLQKVCVHSPLLSAPVLVTPLNCSTAPLPVPFLCPRSATSLLPTASCCPMSSFTHCLSHAPYTPFTFLLSLPVPRLVPHIPASPQNNLLHALSSDTPPLGQDRSCCETVLANFLGHQKVLYIAVNHPIPLWQDTYVPALTHPLLIPREIWNTKDSVVAQIGSGGSFHEFCTSVCLSLYEAQQHRPAPQSADASDTSRCSVCHKPGEVNKSLVLPKSWRKYLGLAALSLGQDQGICQVFLWCEASAPELA